MLSSPHAPSHPPPSHTSGLTLYLLHCPTSYTSTLSTLSRTQPSSPSTSYAFPSTFFISAIPSHTPSPILSPFYTHHCLHVAPFYRVCHLHSQTFTFSSSYSPPPPPSSPLHSVTLRTLPLRAIMRVKCSTTRHKHRKRHTVFLASDKSNGRHILPDVSL